MDLVFMVGTGRCGSSFIQELICKHEDIGFISNWDDRASRVGFKGRFNSVLFRGSLGRLTKKGRRIRFSTSEAYNIISSRVSPIFANSSRDLVAEDVTPWLENRFGEFFFERMKVQAKPCFCHKYTGWSRMGFFSKIFPEAKFINIIRDGRAVANSWLQMPWWGGYRGPENWLWGPLSKEDCELWHKHERSYVSLAGLSWKILMESFEESQQYIQPSRYMEIKYEEFLEHPRETMSIMIEFMGLRWTRNFEEQFRRAKVNAGRKCAYKDDLNESQVDQLTSIIKEKLRKYSYPL